MASSTPRAKIPPFGFSGKPGENYFQFRMAILGFCHSTECTEEESKFALQKSMRDSAQEKTALINHDCSFLTLLLRYDLVFAPSSAALAARVQFDELMQLRGEDLVGFHRRVASTWKNAYSGEPVGPTAINQFVKGLNSPSIQVHLRLMSPTDFDLTLLLATSYEEGLEKTRAANLRSLEKGRAAHLRQLQRKRMEREAQEKKGKGKSPRPRILAKQQSPVTPKNPTETSASFSSSLDEAGPSGQTQLHVEKSTPDSGSTTDSATEDF
jgi:hypothetical protein